MFDESGTDGVMETVVGKAAKRSEAGFTTTSGGRSIATRSFETVTKLDRRRFYE